MSKSHRIAAGGLSFTQHQWDFLRQIPAGGRLSLFTPKDQSLARSLAEIGAVHIDAGIRNAPESRQVDPSLPIWHVAPTAGLAVDGDVVIILVQTDPPTGSQIGIKVDIPTKRLIGLPTDRESYAIVSEVNIDRWPNPGMKWILGSKSEFVYPGTVPGPMLSRISKAWLQARELSN
jgi:hypothetical protein